MPDESKMQFLRRRTEPLDHPRRASLRHDHGLPSHLRDLNHNAHLPQEVRDSLKRKTPTSRSFDYGSLTQTLTDSRTVQQIAEAYQQGGPVAVMRLQSSWIGHHPLYAMNAAMDVFAMTAQFVGGFGPEDHHFGPASAESKLMAQTPEFAYALWKYYREHVFAFRPLFGLSGYWHSGTNPAAQFVGGFQALFHASNNVLFITLENTTSFGSLMADRPWAFRHSHDQHN